MKVRPSVILTLAALLFAATFIAWVSSAFVHARSAARWSQCKGNLHGLGLAMHNYHQVHAAFPPAYVPGPDGERWHSWRVLILPYIDQKELYADYRFDEPWDGPHNRLLVGRMPRIYACPDDPVAAHEFRTNYFVVVGEDTAFPGAKAVSFDEIETDKSATILIVESATLKVNWMKPQDLSFETMSFIVNDHTNPSISSNHFHGTSIYAVNGTSMSLRHTERGTATSAELLQNCLIRDPMGPPQTVDERDVP